MNRPSAAVLPGLAPRSVRLAAALVDGLVAVPLLLLVVVAGVSSLGLSIAALAGPLKQREWMSRAGTVLAGSAAWVVFAAAGLALGGLVLFQWYLLSTRGQTIGKWLLGIRIVDLEGAPSGFFSALVLRSWVFPGVMSAVVSFSSSVLPFAGLVFWLLDYLPLFGQDRRCLHDYLAGTQVRWVRVIEPRVGRLVVGGLGVALVGGLVAVVLNRGAFLPSTTPQPTVPEAVAVATPLPVLSDPVFHVTVELPKAGSVTGPKVEAPPAPAPSLPEPKPELERRLYQFTDQYGVVHVTDDLGSVPQRFREHVTTP